MYEINFYADKNGKQAVKEYIEKLASKENKDSRIKLNKIQKYLQLLSNYGIAIGEPYIKHIDSDIWELRPLRDRIFFFCWNSNRFILLHHFMKQTQKTPKREIEQAKRNMIDFIERSSSYE